MSSLTYARYEMLRTVRNVRFLLFSLAFPLVLLVVVGGANKGVTDFYGTGISFPLYYLSGMIAWGSLMAVISAGGRISPERQLGWVRQLRLTPLTARAYLGTKVLTGYLLALLTIVVLGVTAVGLLDVRMPVASWAQMILLVLVALVPFAALGVWLGHVLRPDSLGPAMGGLSALFALLGGAWGPLTGDSGALHDLAQLVPSYWLVQAGRSAYTGEWWPPKAWLVIGVWTVAAAALARRAYLRDGARV